MRFDYHAFKRDKQRKLIKRIQTNLNNKYTKVPVSYWYFVNKKKIKWYGLTWRTEVEYKLPKGIYKVTFS